MSRSDDGGTEQENNRSIDEIAHDYLRAVDEHEAKVESFLADCAEEYYEPGYLDDSEWDTLKELVQSNRLDDAMVVVEVAVYRKVTTEEGREDEFEGDWPAKGGAK